MATSPTPEFEIVEKLLERRDATLDSAMNWLHRKLQAVDSSRLRRIELRFSSQGAKPMDIPEAQARLGELCRQMGLVRVALSVRTHELPIDQILGHMHIRLLLEPLPTKEATVVPWRRWIQERFAKLAGLEDDELRGAIDPTQEQRHALNRLREELVRVANEHLGADRPQTVQGLFLEVFSQKVHSSLGPLMPPADTNNAKLWMAKELKACGLEPDAQLQVHYEYRAPLSDSTNLVIDCNLKARLLFGGEAVPTPPAPQPIDTPMPTQCDETPHPVEDAQNATTVQEVMLVVLGTWQAGVLEPLSQPFEASLGGLPTQFSRSMLELVGFTATTHGALAGAASNSTPLGLVSDGQGGIKLHTAARPGGLPMYHFVADGQPCLGEHPLNGPLQLVVNGPSRLQNGLWPLVIELRPTDSPCG